MNRVSLYIPCFNAEKSIEPCLEGIFKQSMPLDEVVVIDDGSTDKTVELALKYPVRVIRHQSNKGLACARNTAIKNINSEFIACLDADCQPETEWLASLLKRFNSPKIAGVGGKLVEHNRQSPCDLWRSVHMKQHWDDQKINPPFLFGSNTVFRKERLTQVGCYDENYKTNFEDVDISNRLKKSGYNLIYESKAVARHLRSDDIRTLLNNYWKWRLTFYQKEGFYSDTEKFSLKIKDNIGLANRYLSEDIKSKRHKIIYLDFLLAIHHSLMDFSYFISCANPDKAGIRPYSALSSRLSLLDLTFFYHYNSLQKRLDTLIPGEDSFLQNFLALNLILSSIVNIRFSSKAFKKKLYGDLFLSIYNINDASLLDSLFRLSESHPDWSGLFLKKQDNLNRVFLEALFLNLKKWVEDLSFGASGVIRSIESSAQRAQKQGLNP